MSTETTPAIEAAVEALRDRSDAYDPDEQVATAVVRAALDAIDLPTVIADAYTKFLFDPEKPHMTRSISQAIRSTLLGGAS